MSIELHRHTRVAMDRHGVVSRRDFLRGISTAGLVAGTLSWSDLMSLQAADLRKQGKACILLWMQGGPSQFETFDPKPGVENGGETKAIPTAVSGIQICSHYPELAKQMNDIALIRSMTSKEGSHPRATFLLHTGYLPTATVKFPTLGAIVAHEIGNPAGELPSFVRIGGRRASSDGGLLGTQYDPFDMATASSAPTNTKPTTSETRYKNRLALIEQLETDVAQEAPQEVADHKKLYDRAARMILSPQMKAFEVDRETSAVREAYGRSQFGNACLLARRLIEADVTFVELNVNGWDTHQDNFDRTKQLAGQIDKPIAQLIADLKQRGRLENTLVIWMGEFGRTPRINPRGGRDHYPRAFNVALAGGGVRGGQVIGRTDKSGASVADRPVTVPDLFQTFCQSLNIDAKKENMSSVGRPIKIVDGGTAVKELFA